MYVPGPWPISTMLGSPEVDLGSTFLTNSLGAVMLVAV